jgi:hypothetical protein
MFLNKTSTAGQADALNVFVKRLEDHIELLNRKCALQRHELWDYKKKQMNYCVSLTQKNRKLREERLSVGKKCLQDVVEVKHGAEINSFLQNTAKIRTESFISKKTKCCKMKQDHKSLEKVVKRLREEVFYWEQHHSEHLQATLSAVLDQQDRVLCQYLDHKSENSGQTQTKANFNIPGHFSGGKFDAMKNEQKLKMKLAGLNSIFKRYQLYSSEKIMNLERKFLSVKQINIGLERRLLQLTQHVELLKHS